MDRDFLIDLFAPFGPVTIRRMFSGYGISADGINFALALRGTIFLRADQQSIARFEAEGCKPFQYQTKVKTVIVVSYWELPERLFDDPDEFAQWARVALTAAERAALATRGKAKPAVKKVGKKSAAKKPAAKRARRGAQAT
jgi:DNA transformation protein